MRHVTRHSEIIVQARRGGTVESTHRAVAALAAPDGELVECWGDPGLVTFWRSCAKPLQAQTWLADGTAAHFGWGQAELAVLCGSHDGGPEPVAVVRRMLAGAGLSEQDLRCHQTLGARHACSGNHAGFLAACVYHDWDVAGYQAPAHPAQQAALRMVAACTELDPDTMTTATDGCGVVTYATPLSVAAAAYALLPALLPELAAAMHAHPLLVQGPGGLDTVLMQALPGATSKRGAEGLACVSLPDGRGLTVKVTDGAARALAPAVVAALRAVLGHEALPPAVAALGRPVITSEAGAPVGDLLAVAPA